MYRYILIFPLLAFLCACNNNNSKSIDEIKNPTAADSMMYYFGEMQANNFWQDSETDTLLRTEAGRREFMEGFRAAMKMESDNDAYNKGLQLGLRLAIRLREFHAAYGEDFSEEVLASSLERALANDTAFDVVEAQKNYYRIKDRFDLEKGIKESGSAKQNLAKLGKAEGFEMLNDTLFVKDVAPGNGGQKFKDGDRVAIQLNSSTLDGREIGRQFPDSITIGEGRVPRVVCVALHSMTSGQTCTFMTTPQTLFGKQFSRYQLNADEPVIFTVRAVRN